MMAYTITPMRPPMPKVRFPLKVKGNLEWGKNRLPLDASFAP
jgi:hypothetical protein